MTITNNCRNSTIKVDPKQFKDDGHLILRSMIPPDMLQPLRDSFEKLVRLEWPNGYPDGIFQPRIHGYEKHVDESTVNTVQFLFHENTLGVARQLMNVQDVGIAYHSLMCNPVKDYGPWFWHRDFTPITEGPLQGAQTDFLANGPELVQWNIALYDDDVFWIVPGSHVRPNTDAQNAQLAAVPHSYANRLNPRGQKRHTPLPGSMCVNLKAGDGVVYVNMLLHWASRYGPKLRRCIHFDHRAFGGQRFYHQGFSRNLDYTKHLSPSGRAACEQCLNLYDEECDHIEQLFRAVLARDEEGFHEHLAALHPGEDGRFVCLIHLCKTAQTMAAGKGEHASRFTSDELALLWQRFTALDESLKADEDQLTPGFQVKGPTRYHFYDLPKDFGINEFVKSWSS